MKKFICLGILFLIGCSSELTFTGRGGGVGGGAASEPAAGSGGSPQEVGSACEGDKDCLQGDFCVGYRSDVTGDYGSCTRECEDASQCGPEAFCGSDGWCWKECPDGECDNPSSVCLEREGHPSCESADGYLADICQSDSWCVHTPGGICLDGLCSSPCVVDGDCPSDGFCMDSFCRLPCDVDSDCRYDGGYSHCASGYCQPL